MAGLKDTINGVTAWLKTFFELGVALILLFIIIDILFPGTTGVVDNVGEVVASFSREGIVGVIALLFFLWIFKK